jgi:hypothetical protein
MGWLGWAPSHPSPEQLFEWHEGALDVPAQMWVSAHVRSCARCRAEAGAMREVIVRASAALTRAGRIPDGAHGVKRLRAALTNQRLLAAARSRVLGESDARLAELLRPFFGFYPSVRLQRREGGPAGFRDEAILLAQTLLGRKAAEALLKSPVAEAAVE